MIDETRRLLASGGGGKPLKKLLVYNEVQLTLYSIGYLSYTTLIAQVTLRKWEIKKILPPPIFVLANGLRWYTPAEVLAFSAAITTYLRTRKGQVQPALAKLRDELWTASATIRKNYKNLSKASATHYPDVYFTMPADKALEKKHTARRQKLYTEITKAQVVVRKHTDETTASQKQNR